MDSVRARLRRPTPRWGLVVFVGALLVGLLGMHALAMSCGIGTPVPTGSSSAVASSAVPGVDLSTTDVAHGTDATDHAQHGTDQLGADGSMTSALMSVCVGLLVSALVLLAAVLAVSAHRGWHVPRLRSVDLRRALRLTRRPPSPPTQTQLCLLRC